MFGTINVSNSSGVMDPTWKCFLDGREVPIPETIPFTVNNWRLCDFDAGTVGARLHTLLVQVTSVRRHFWLDHIEYTPSPSSLSPQNEYVSVASTDPAIIYDGSWAPLGNIANYTTTPGATVTLTFNGTGLDWYGLTPVEMPHGASRSTYSLDGESPVEFTVRGLGDGVDVTQYNRRLFSTPDRPYGIHNITVEHLGHETPLTLGNLIIRDSTSPASQTQTINVLATPTSTSTSSDSASSGSLGSSGVSPGTVAGAVIGVLLGLLLIAAGFVFGRRWYRKRTRPVIQPMPGFVQRSASTAPLDIDMPTRYSVELEERMQQYGHLPMGSPRHIRRRSRTFNPEVRETITSMDFDAPPMQHAPPTMSNPDRDSVLSDAPPPTPEKDPHLQLPGTRGRTQGKSGLYQEISQVTESTASVNVVTQEARSRHTQSSTSLGRDAYTSGYPYATDTSGMSNYEQLVAATKAEEARLEQQRRRSRSRRRP